MANDASTPETPQSETVAAQIQIAVDWDNGNVIIQPVYPEGYAGPPGQTLSIPAETFVQAGVAIGMQLLERLRAMQPKSGIQLARPGDLPPGLKLH